ncbi:MULTISPECIES: SDR family NAD(P)-dependent oxidoreductase [unclassified Streptomyces]|uniref:SDR family oxidoreductase n=1 Tax=Streptomyces sp. NBC_00119 TaxID=2975659 RepID=A0AAU1U2W2_9ACTN|nr:MULTISPECIES: SDR family NAD(P)-dependent oxidoreductase [unclassified Streptomyces]MCX4641334.1 SDR family oxidoreductase [Streptomyces sp. NBC_01446]MCX5322249.1 SDR family oxidoreductase [Streptomyces sp. NBC_00120]
MSEVVRQGRFTDKVALVTGAGSGMGAAIARQLAAEGARYVVAADLNGDAVKAVAAELPAAAAAAVALDVADAAAVEGAVADVVREHGRLDVVVHAAGVDDPQAKQLIADALVEGRPPEVTDRLDDASWRRVMQVNLDGTFHVLRASVRAMRPAEAGAIVVIGSSSAFDAPVGYPHYAASKAGVHALSQAVAKEVIASGIRVNVVAPGPTETGMAARTPKALRNGFADPRVRPYATPEEIGDIALFLASDASANLVGAVLLANGGRFTA